MNPLEILRTKLSQLHGDSKAIEAAAAAQGRAEFTTEEQTKLSELHAAFQATEAQIALHERNAQIEASASAPQASKTAPSPVGPTTSTPAFAGARVQAISATHANHGFTRGFGEYLNAVKKASFGQLDPRLMNAVTTYGGEGVGADGGFAVPPDMRSAIIQAWGEDENLMQHFPQIQTSSNQVTLVSDETTPHSTGGITGAWRDEAATITPTKPVLKQVTVALRAVSALVHLTDEVIEDSPVIASYVAKKMGQKLSALVSDAILNGNGLVKPLGIASSPALVSVTRTTANKVKADDIGNMVARLRPGSFGRSFWLMNSSVLPQIWTMTLGGTAASTPVYATNFKDSPYGTLFGRPIYVSEYCMDLTDAGHVSGDIYLINPEGYALAVKSSGLQTATSIHAAFDQAMQSFRATVRVGGTPFLSGAIARANGTETLSDFVRLSHV
jgi:HK97 family phage major capsid protein